MSKLFVHLVTWNGAKYIPYLFESLRQQTYREWELLVIDNNSTDDTVLRIQQELINFPVSSRLIVNSDNRGFAGGHNQAFQETLSEYILVLNQDMYLMPDCLEKLIVFSSSHPEAAAIAPRLMRWNFSGTHSPGGRVTEGDGTPGLTNQIDALGLRVFRNRRAIEQGNGEEWTGGVGAQEVFGVSGAFALFRRKALKAVAFPDGTFFDPWYFMYKEDLDLAYRLRSVGFKSYVLLDAVAYHDRTGAGARELNDWVAAQNKKLHNHTVTYYSYSNHLATLYKNEYWQNFLLDWPWIDWYEFKKFVYFLLFDRKVLKGLSDLWVDRKDLKTKRLKIKDLRKINWKEMRKWWE